MIIKVASLDNNNEKKLIKCEDYKHAENEVNIMKTNGNHNIKVLVICLEEDFVPNFFEYLGYEEDKDGRHIKYYMLRCA